MNKPQRISVKRAARKDIRDIAQLEMEFDEYLQEIAAKARLLKRKTVSLEQCAQRLSKDWFRKGEPFQGFIARREGRAQGYLLYHFGYDPEEMEGKVVYVVDFFVKKLARRSGEWDPVDGKNRGRMREKQGNRHLLHGMGKKQEGNTVLQKNRR